MATNPSLFPLRPAPPGEPFRLMDEELEREREREHQEEVRAFREWYAGVLQRRQEERRARDLLKQQQLELAEQWQVWMIYGPDSL